MCREQAIGEGQLRRHHWGHWWLLWYHRRGARSWPFVSFAIWPDNCIRAQDLWRHRHLKMFNIRTFLILCYYTINISFDNLLQNYTILLFIFLLHKFKIRSVRQWVFVKQYISQLVKLMTFYIFSFEVCFSITLTSSLVRHSFSLQFQTRRSSRRQPPAVIPRRPGRWKVPVGGRLHHVRSQTHGERVQMVTLFCAKLSSLLEVSFTYLEEESKGLLPFFCLPSKKHV